MSDARATLGAVDCAVAGGTRVGAMKTTALLRWETRPPTRRVPLAAEPRRPQAPGVPAHRDRLNAGLERPGRDSGTAVDVDAPLREIEVYLPEGAYL